MEDSVKAAEELSNAIVQLKERAETATRAAEEASSKANSESGFAFNAKVNAEEHAKAIAQVRGTVDAEFAGLATTKKNAEEAVSAITASKGIAEASARAVSETRVVVENDAAVSKAASERSTAALSVIDKAQTDVAAALKEVSSGAAAIALTKANADEAFGAMQALQAQLAEIAPKAKTDVAAIAKIEADSKSLFTSLAKVVTTAEEAEVHVTEYEKRLAKLTDDFSELNKKIEGLLPNATSAGLASAFRNQKDRFKNPQKIWLITFILTILLLLSTGIFGMPSFGSSKESDETLDAILRHLMSRLPLIIPLVWLGIYAGRNYMLALRLEEEYAFKEAVSTAFEGYKREMTDISVGGNTNAPPLIVLCENVLHALTQRPGRIYEGRHEDITPLSPVKGLFGIKVPNNATKEPTQKPD